MTQDNVQQDTPQGGSNEEFASLEEAVFGNENGGSQDTSSAFTSEKEGSAAQAPEGQPSADNKETANTTDNDKTRYQYWQSQADKYKNELASMQQQQAQMARQAPQPQQNANQVAEPVEAFPDAPNKPQRPRSFSREEAFSDSSSESARYMDELDDWRDNMNEYNTLKSQYHTAVMEDKFNKIEEAKAQEHRRSEAMRQQATQQNDIKQHVMGHYGMDNHEAMDFMDKMSNPNSITIDTLVQ